MKKIISIILTLLLTVMPITAYAEDKESSIAPNMIAKLESENGEEVYIYGVMENIQYSTRTVGDEKIAKYKFEVDLTAAERAIQTGEHTITEWDSGNSTEITITVHYKRKDIDGIAHYLLTSTEASWVIHDYNTSVTNAKLICVCEDLRHSDQTATYDSIPNGYHAYPGFTEYIDSVQGEVGATVKIDFLMGTSRRWSFECVNTVIGAGSFA